MRGRLPWVLQGSRKGGLEVGGHPGIERRGRSGAAAPELLGGAAGPTAHAPAGRPHSCAAWPQWPCAVAPLLGVPRCARGGGSSVRRAAGKHSRPAAGVFPWPALPVGRGRGRNARRIRASRPVSPGGGARALQGRPGAAGVRCAAWSLRKVKTRRLPDHPAPRGPLSKEHMDDPSQLQGMTFPGQGTSDRAGEPGPALRPAGYTVRGRDAGSIPVHVPGPAAERAARRAGLSR